MAWSWRWPWKGCSMNNSAGSYPPAFALIYMFNLILGAGPLALPKAFSLAGLLLGTLLLVFLAFMSFMTATFMIEAMASANAFVRHKIRMKSERETLVHKSDSPSLQKDLEPSKVDYESGSETEKEIIQSHHKEEKIPLVTADQDKGDTTDKEAEIDSGDIHSEDYEITEKFEMGAIANMFYKPFGIVFYYIIICLYLYGTLAIDLVVITKSLVTVTCAKPPDDDNRTDNAHIAVVNVTSTPINGTEIPTKFPGQFISHQYCIAGITQRHIYYIFLSITALLICPWTYFNFTSSKYLQVMTTILRNIAFGLMIGIAIAKLAMGMSADPLPPLARLPGFPVLFGVSVYAFMTQHCLPGMITPMTTKRGITWMILGNFSFILVFYLLLSYTAVFRFATDELFDIYTINFFKLFEFSDNIGDRVLSVLGYYIILYPIFTLTTNFPISSITLRENLKALARVIVKPWMGDKQFPFLLELFLFPTVAILPPLAIAFGTTSIEVLMSITGGFPGVWLQYMIPASLAFAGKYIITKKLKMEYKNKHKSPFNHIFFLIFVIIWTITSMILLITDDILSIVNHTFFKYQKFFIP